MLAPAPRTLSNDGVIDAAKAALGDMIVDTLDAVGEIALTIDRPRLTEAMIGLRVTPGLKYQQLMEISGRSEGRRVGEGSVSACSSRWAPSNETNKRNNA